MLRRPRLTILRARGLGDLLTVVPALRALARVFPDHRRLLLAPDWLAPLLPLITEQGEPCVDALFECPGLDDDPGALPGWPEVAVNLHGRGPESHHLLLATGPGQLIAFRHHEVPETAAMPRWRADESETQRWCRLLRSCGIPADPSELAIDPPAVAAPPRARGAILIHPGAEAGARHWPPQRWATLAASEQARGRTVTISGFAAEVGLANRIATEAGLDPGCVIAGRTDLPGLAAHVAAAAVVASADAGVARLATALGVPSVSSFDPARSLRRKAPLGRRHRALWGSGAGDRHAAVDSGLLKIEAEAALAQLRALRG